MSLKRLFGAVAAAAIVSSGANAQTQQIVSNPTGIVANYNLEQVESLLGEFGYAAERGVRNDGVNFIRTQINGLTLLLVPSVCGGGSCRGLQMVCFFTDHTATTENMDNYNEQFKPSRMFTTENGWTFFTRYMIGDFGYTRGSFQVNLGVFASSPDAYFKNFASTSQNMISYEPESVASAPANTYKPGEVSPTDEFAEDLNAKQMKALNTLGAAASDAAGAWGGIEKAGLYAESDFDFSGFSTDLGNHTTE